MKLVKTVMTILALSFLLQGCSSKPIQEQALPPFTQELQSEPMVATAEETKIVPAETKTVAKKPSKKKKFKTK